ncbi:polysaccharide deacetylase family protein [Ureibacillus aquaedulcis]|uniref:Polysaccharide deacetylase family protein n=1 Tax=Ureibacillus aquaedulcis TaxID=3058421 RepID=A0ABT8GTT3_9BACL|nr:polysaccharide deacetylase family protein [Ureibacillus sp. BA0131]MDN4494813.1 polysaccharide deacetylase family protein [Ureibacillus sp. BA0131]
MKRQPWLDVLLLSSIFMLTVLIGMFIFISGDSKYQLSTVSASSPVQQTEKTATEAEKAEKTASESAVELPSDFEGIQLFKETPDDQTNPYTIIHPTTKYNKLNQEISQYIEKTKQHYLSRAEQKKKENPLAKSNLKIQVKISKYKQTYYSIVFTKKETLDGKNTDETFNTIVFNNKTGQKIIPWYLFNQDAANLDKLSKYVRQKMLEQKGYKEHINLSKWNKASYPYWERYNRFAIENDALVLYYNKGEFSNTKIGSPSLSIPLAFINPILAPEFRTETKSEITILTPIQKEKPGKRVALTFDDGPHRTITNEILNMLDKYDAKATFFMVGKQVEENTTVAKDVLARGHEVGNHTWNHAKLTKLTSKSILSEVNSTNNMIFKATGQYPTVFRPPYGAKNKQVTELMKVPVVLWTIDTLDWKYRDSSKLLPMIQKNIRNNDIILMHDIHQSTADGLESVLIYLQKQGYECVTVSEIINSQK